MGTTMNAWARWCLGLTWLAFAAAPALAQPKAIDLDRRSYVAFDIDKNVADLVQKRLELEKNLGPLKDLIKQVLANPTSRNAGLVQKLEGVKLDEKLKQAFQEMMGNDPALKNELRQWIKKNNDGKQSSEAAKSLKDLDQLLTEPKKPPAPADPGKQPADMRPKEDAKPDETIRKVLEDGLKKAEHSELGDWLKDSPAWQQAFRDLRTSLENPQASKWKLNDWQAKLLAPDGKAWKLGEAAVERLKNLPPDLERWNPNLAIPGLGNIPTPTFAPPVLPTFAGPTLSAGVTWLLLVVLSLLVGWQVMHWSKRFTAEVDPRARLGRWPIKPGAVATRADLIQAFDYLAILTLGFAADSWDHQTIARRWSALAPASAPMANALARLYEVARYTDGPSALTPPQRDQARQALLHLMEAR